MQKKIEKLLNYIDELESKLDYREYQKLTELAYEILDDAVEVRDKVDNLVSLCERGWEIENE